MAVDYLSALADFRNNGGTDINEFLDQHTVRDGSAVAARLAAAESAQRIASGGLAKTPTRVGPAAAGGNILTAEADLPPGVGGTYYQGPLANPKPSPTPTPRVAAAAETDLPPGAEGTYYGGPLANPRPSPTPANPNVAVYQRREAPLFNANVAAAAQMQAQAAQFQPKAGAEVPWWQRSSFTPEFQKFVNNTQREQATRGQIYQPGSTSPPISGGGFIRLNRNTYIPQAVNYNGSASSV